MKKRVLIVAGVATMALMTGCGGKKVETPPVESSAVTSTGIDTKETVDETKEDESSQENGEVAVEVEDDMDYTVFKAPNTTSDDAGEYVVMYGMIGDHLEDGSYEVYTANGMFVFNVDEHTIIEEGVELTNGTYVEVINTGVVTMSLPGQIANVLEVKVVNEEDVLAEGRNISELNNGSNSESSEDSGVMSIASDESVEVSEEIEESELSENTSDLEYPEVEYIGDDVIFFGEVKSIAVDADKDYVEYTVDTANGTKVFLVNKEMVIEDIKKGSNIKAVTDGVETRSIPGILSGVKKFELAE